ncbi:motility protein A [bacterium]|nr:motility protein A [bacterium]
MDLATIGGVVIGLLFVIGSIMMGGDIGGFINIPSVMIVVGGAFAATFVNFPLKTVVEVMNVAKKTFQHQEVSPVDTINTLVRLAEKARREGILAIEKSIYEIDDPFMKTGIQLAVDGSEPEIIRSIMENELSNLENRHRIGQAVMHSLGTYAPAFGMIGTLIGLIQMLRKLEDPTQIGAGMAVALITTFYGAVLANLVFLPMEGKLKNRTLEEIQRREMIIDGILAIQSGDNPRVVRGKLMTYVSPKERGEEAA